MLFSRTITNQVNYKFSSKNFKSGILLKRPKKSVELSGGKDNGIYLRSN